MNLETVSKDAPSQSLKRVKITFILIYFFFMTSRALFGPYISVYLQDKGLSSELIGVVTGINSFAIIVTQPLWGIIADKIRSSRKTLILATLGQALFAFSLIFASNFFLISIFFFMYTSFSASEGTLMDTWMLKSLKGAGDTQNSVGPIKTWGCLGYAAASIASGWIISKTSIDAIIPVFVGLIVLISITMFFVRTNEGYTASKAASLKEMQLGRIFKDKTFLIFLVYVFFMQMAHRGSFTFFPILIKDFGGSTQLVGYASALMFVSEAIIMFFSKKMLSKIRPETLIMLSSLFFVLWHVFLSLSSKPIHVVLACLMDGPSFALFSIGMLYYLDAIAPKDIRTTYQTVAYSVYFGLSGIVGNVAFGWMKDHFGYQKMYWIGICITLTATVVFFFVNKFRTQKQTLQSNS